MQPRERVQATPRKAMTPARRRAILAAQDGRCACGARLIGRWIADHVLPLWLGGADDASNLVGRCPPCDKLKTAADARDRAKVKRIIRREAGEQRATRSIPSRPLTHPTLKRGVNNRVERRNV